MSSPKVIVQIFVTGSKILGKAFFEAGRQAVKNARYTPQGAVDDAPGVGHATSGSPTDQLTRQHRMTLDEAQLILNVKRDDQLETVLKNYEHLFKANSPPTAKPEKPKPTPKGATSKAAIAAYHSHYLQSKVVCARQRIEAEFKLAESSSEEAASEASTPDAEKGEPSSTEPPPPSSKTTQ